MNITSLAPGTSAMWSMPVPDLKHRQTLCRFEDNILTMIHTSSFRCLQCEDGVVEARVIAHARWMQDVRHLLCSLIDATHGYSADDDTHLLLTLGEWCFASIKICLGEVLCEVRAFAKECPSRFSAQSWIQSRFRDVVYFAGRGSMKEHDLVDMMIHLWKLNTAMNSANSLRQT